MNDIYNKTFYRNHVDESISSAEIIAPYILKVFPVKSVIDVGCGTGAWLRVFQQMGVREIHGWDVNSMAEEDYAIERSRIRTGCDFTSLDFRIDHQADICISLEVAEHLPETAANNFVLNLTACSPVVIFSAAYPGQTGVNHINEQPPWYWRNIFNQCGYFELDFLRPLLWKNEQVSWWYRQNITSYIHIEYIKKNPNIHALFKEYGQRNGPHRLTLVNEWILGRQPENSMLKIGDSQQSEFALYNLESNDSSSHAKLTVELADHLLSMSLSPSENRLIARIFQKYNHVKTFNAFLARARTSYKAPVALPSGSESTKEGSHTRISCAPTPNKRNSEKQQIVESSFLNRIPSHLSEKEKNQLDKIARLKARDGAVFVELGSYLGGSSCYIANAIKLSQSNTRLYCIDTWANEGMTEGLRDTYTEFKRNITPFEDIIVPLRGRTDQVVNYFKKKIDFLFIDADHSYEGVSRDIHDWLPLLKDDAIIAFHDYTWFEGVKRAVQQHISTVEAGPGELTDSLYCTSIDTRRINKESEKPKLLFVMPALERIYYYNPRPYVYEPHSKLMPNVSGLFIGSYLEKFDCVVNLFDFVEHYRKDGTIDREKLWHYLQIRVDLFSPDFIGMNVWPQTLETCRHFTALIKQTFPHLTVIWGGHFVALACEKELLESPADFFIKYGGEIPLQKILAGTPIFEVENVLYKSDDRILSTTEKIFTGHDYELDLKWSLIDSTTYFKPVMDLESATFEKTAMVVFNRGCPNRCNFCVAQNGTFPKPVWLTNQSLSREVNKLYEQHRIGHIHVADDLTFRSKRNLEDFIKKFQETAAFGNVKFTISTRVDRLKDEEYLHNLEKVGVVSVRVGVESDSEKILNKMDKKSTAAFNWTILRNAYDSPVKHIFMMISGYLDECRTDAMLSIKYLMRNFNMSSRFWVSEYQLYRGSHDYQANAHRINSSNFTSMTTFQANRYDRFIRDIESAHNVRFSIQSLMDLYCATHSQDKAVMALPFKSKPASYFYDLSVDPKLFVEQNRLWRKYYLLTDVPQELRNELYDTILMLYLSKRTQKLNRLMEKHLSWFCQNDDFLELMIKIKFYNGELNESVALIDSYGAKNHSMLILRRFIKGFEAYTRQHRQYLLAENIPFLNEMSLKPYLSVIIPTRDRAKLLGKALASLTAQTYPDHLFEVIVVDNGSSDQTLNICKNYANRIRNFRYFYVSEPGLHNGRHAGCNASHGDILIYCDDDIYASSSWLEGISECFDNPDVALAGGNILPEFEISPPEWLNNLWTKTSWGKILGNYSLIDFGDNMAEISPMYVWGANLAIKKNILLEMGGFHPDGMPPNLSRFRGDGETYVSRYIQKRGYKTIYNPKATVFHWISKERMTPKYLYKRMFLQGISDSFTYIRTFKRLGELKQNQNMADSIQDTLQKGHCDGFNYHHKEVSNDPELLKWVLKENYFDCTLTKEDRIYEQNRRMVKED